MNNNKPEPDLSGLKREEKSVKEINCSSCRHFYITYDPQFPYGCRAAGFKSRGLPYREMAAHSGMECQLFAVKGKKG